MDAELAEEEARLLRKRVGEYTVVIENNTEMLANASGSLFEHEKARYSEQIRQATAALEELRDEIMEFALKQLLVVITGQAMIDGLIDPDFSAWLRDVLSAEDDPKTATAPSSTIVRAAYNTVTSDSITLRVTASDEEPAPPDTGDHTSLPLYLAIAALALVALVLYRRREREKQN